MPGPKSRPATADPQTIEQLKRRYEDLHKRKIQAETSKEHSEKRLQEVKKQALNDYKTDDLTALKKKLATIKSENERMRSEYQSHLDQLEADLDRVTAEHKAAMNEAGDS
jgi:uncharacterized protein involved in exopolysaccharide biosynthesis